MEAKLQPNGDILLHFGVKGMRWGIRKQRKTKGRKRKTKKEDVKEKRFCKKATKQASDKGSKAALTAIALGCTALAAAVFFADTAHREAFKFALKRVTDTVSIKRKSIHKRNDILVDVRRLTHKIAMGVTPSGGLIIPKGQEFSRITGRHYNSLKSHHGGLYAAFSERDVQIYKDFIKPSDGNGSRHQILMKNKEDLYIPSRAVAESLYRDLMKNDKNYRKDMNRAMYRMLAKRYGNQYGKYTNDMIKEAIEEAWEKDPMGFNFQNTVMTNKGKAYKKYARKLAKAGYDGVLDYHDIDGKFTVAPVIITNKDKLKLTKSRKIL